MSDRPRPRLGAHRCRLTLIPLASVLLSGCGLIPDSTLIVVRNHTAAAIVVRDANAQDCVKVTVPAHATRELVVTVTWYDADVEVDADGLRHTYDFDVLPFQYWLDLVVRDDDFLPFASG